MGRQEDIKIQIETVPPSKFAELIQCPEVLVAHHKHLNDNDWIKVGPFEEAYRRVAYITPWECSSKRLKRLVPYDLLKVVEKQHLQLIRDDTGTLAEAILTTHPSIASVPVMGTISMGTVVIRVCTEPGFDGCVAHMNLDCNAKGLGWLWSVKSFVEETMLVNARRVALHCVEFIADVAKGVPSAVGLLEEIKKGRHGAPADVKADTNHGLIGSENTCESAPSRGSEEVTQRSLSRVSISSAASGASAYFDAPEDLPDNPGDSKTGATEIQDVTSRLQRGCSFNLSVTASTAAAAAGEHCTRAGSFSTKGRANETKDAASKAAPPKKQRQCKAAQPQRQPQTHAQPKGRRNFLGESRSDLLLCSHGRLNPTLEALQQTLHRIQQDVDIIREQTTVTNALRWQTFAQGAVLGAGASAAAAWLMWRASRLRH